jgi:hypothetical protein
LAKSEEAILEAHATPLPIGLGLPAPATMSGHIEVTGEFTTGEDKAYERIDLQNQYPSRIKQVLLYRYCQPISIPVG